MTRSFEPSSEFGSGTEREAQLTRVVSGRGTGRDREKRKGKVMNRKAEQVRLLSCQNVVVMILSIIAENVSDRFHSSFIFKRQ